MSEAPSQTSYTPLDVKNPTQNNMGLWNFEVLTLFVQFLNYYITVHMEVTFITKIILGLGQINFWTDIRLII